MLNYDIRNKSIERLQSAVSSYNTVLDEVKRESQTLFECRNKASTDVIVKVDKYINTLANTPKEFDKEFSEIRAYFQNFLHYVFDLQAEAARANYAAGGVAGAGTVVGAGVAALGPTAALAVATTFGTASTGAAITALSGAAATNAALAWLGGGALVAGGGGMAAGQAFLALAGPVGWGISGVAIVGGALLLRNKNKNLAKAATDHRITVEGYTTERRAMVLAIKKLTDLTQIEINGITQLLEELVSLGITDYRSFSGDKSLLAALINHTRALGQLLKKLPNGAS